jgi:hypothetical protein
MKALSVRQPWAWAIIHGGKNIENRNWAPKVRPGRIAIHSAKRWAGDDALKTVELLVDEKMPGEFMLGWIIGTVDVIDTHMPSYGLQGRWGACEVHGCETWGQNVLSHWVLSNPRPGPWIECKGKLGLWTLPDDIAARLT